MRYLFAAIAFCATLAAVGVAAIFALISFAGPHSKPLSEPLLTVVYVVAGLAVVILPPWAARAVFRTGSKTTASTARTADDTRADRLSGSSPLGNAIAKGLGVALLVLVAASLTTLAFR